MKLRKIGNNLRFLFLLVLTACNINTNQANDDAGKLVPSKYKVHYSNKMKPFSYNGFFDVSFPENGNVQRVHFDYGYHFLLVSWRDASYIIFSMCDFGNTQFGWNRSNSADTIIRGNRAIVTYRETDANGDTIYFRHDRLLGEHKYETLNPYYFNVRKHNKALIDSLFDTMNLEMPEKYKK